MRRVIRHDGALWYPTYSYLEEIFERSNLSFRIMTSGYYIGHDPIPRFVLHCNKIITNILIIIGKPFDGKSFLSYQLSKSANKVISLDYFISDIFYSKYCHVEFEKLVKEKTNVNSLGSIYYAIDEFGFTKEYIEQIIKAIAKTDNLVIIEGFMTDKQINELQLLLKGKANTWIVKKS